MHGKVYMCTTYQVIRDSSIVWHERAAGACRGHVLREVEIAEIWIEDIEEVRGWIRRLRIPSRSAHRISWERRVSVGVRRIVE